MSANSRIEWTDASWTPIRARCAGKVGWHCEHVSEGCRNCYAEGMNKRLGTGLRFVPGELQSGRAELFLDEKMLTQPLRWKKPRRIFVCSMTDLFADFVPDAWIDKVFAVMAMCPQHTFQLLTKRWPRMRAYIGDPQLNRRKFAIDIAHQELGLRKPVEYATWPLPNVWNGTSLCNQDDADKFIPELLATAAAVRFVSCEPLLGPVDLGDWMGEAIGASTHRSAGEDFRRCDLTGNPIGGLDWVICGDESGRDRRPCNIDWVRDLRDQCAGSGVPFYLKQLHIDGHKVSMPELDGRIWDEMPGASKGNEARDAAA